MHFADDPFGSVIVTGSDQNGSDQSTQPAGAKQHRVSEG